MCLLQYLLIMFKKCSKHKPNPNQSFSDCAKTGLTFSRLQNNLKYFLLNLLLIILLSDKYFILLANSQQIVDNYNPNAVKSVFSGGLVTGRRVLTLKDSPYYILKDIVVDYKSQLIVESGVTLNFNHSVGVQVLGTLIAKVSDNCPSYIRYIRYIRYQYSRTSRLSLKPLLANIIFTFGRKYGHKLIFSSLLFTIRPNFMIDLNPRLKSGFYSNLF